MLTRRLLAFAGILALALSFASCVRADSAARARKQIEAAYVKYDAAYKKIDADALFRLYDDDFWTSQGVSKAQAEAEKPKLTEAFHKARARITRFKSVIKTFRLKGAEATVTVTQHLEGSMINPRTHKSVSLNRTGDQVMVWVKRGGIWRIKRGS